MNPKDVKVTFQGAELVGVPASEATISIGPLGPFPAVGTAEVTITAIDGRVVRQKLDVMLQQEPGESLEDFQERLRAASMEKVRALAAAVAEAPPDERKH